MNTMQRRWYRNQLRIASVPGLSPEDMKPAPPQLADLLTVQEAAAEYQESEQAISRACRIGLLLADKPFGFWVFQRRHFEQWRDRRRL